MDAGGSGGGGSGGAGEAWVASAGSARHAVLLAIQALCVNEAAVREASAESDAIRAEITWFNNRCFGTIGCNAGAAVHASDSAAGGSNCGTGGLRSASAERSRRALLLVTHVCGVSAVAVQEACAERDALKEELDLSLTNGKQLGGGAFWPLPWEAIDPIVAGPWDVLLCRAARDGAEYSLRHALLQGASVDALGFAINGGKINCLQVLLEAGADKDKADKIGRTPLHLAAKRNTPDCLRLLLEAGADKDKADEIGRTPLHRAAERNTPDCLRLLLEAGAETENADQDDCTALHVAALFGCLDGLRLLLEAGADKNKGDITGRTPLHYAAECGRLDCLRLLLEAGADKNEGDTNGDTPLHQAAWSEHPDCLRLLLEAGANRSARNEEGETPLDVAELFNSKEAAALLRQHAASRAP